VTSLLLAAVLAATTAAKPAAAPAPGPAKDPVGTVRAAERQVRLAFQKGGKRADLERVGATFIAWDELARRSLPGRFEKLSASDRAAYEKALRGLVEETWLSGLFRPDPLYAFAVFGTTTKGGDAEVKTRVRSGERQAPVDLRLSRGKDGRFRIHDWSVNGVSMLSVYQEQFPWFLDQGGMTMLLTTIAAQRRVLAAMGTSRRP
jgi:ABC-type transporter MlaC component